MKFKTFRNLVTAGALIAVVAVCAPCFRSEPTLPPTPLARPSTGRTPTRPLDREIQHLLRSPTSADKTKDAFGGAWKVNLYRDEGKRCFNRVKVDLDRDEKWDEKWDFETEGGEEKVKRHVAPADDEQYAEEYRLENGAWRRK
jgi:hypothetical protein